MVHVNIKSAAKGQMNLAVDVSVCDLPRVNAALQQLVMSNIPPPGPLEGRAEPPVYPDDVNALGLTQVPRFFGELEFSQCPGTKLSLIHGRLTGQVPIRCHGCLGPYIQQLEVKVALAHIYSEDRADSVPDGYEALVIDRQDVTLVELLEDDILLALPLFPKHPEGQCQPLITEEEINTPRDKVSPFAGLKDLLEHAGDDTESKPTL